VRFEADSRLSTLGESAFAYCALQSISIPSSIQAIPEACFFSCRRLSSVTFEAGYRLSVLGEQAFLCCESLLSICVPATVHEIAGSALAGSGIRSVTVDAGSQFFRTSGDLLVDFGETSLVRYFGTEAEVTVSREIEAISAECFSLCKSIVSVRFESGSKISMLGRSAFCLCDFQESIHIPSSIRAISESCFSDCSKLRNLVFEFDCNISNEGEFPFAHCRSLPSICIPSSFDVIPKACFAACTDRVTMTFESVSKIAIIDDYAFRCCGSLRSVCVPPLKQSAHSVSGNAGFLTLWHLSLVQKSRIWANLHLRGVMHGNRFRYHHPLK
jgi:hypothetical protein